MPVLTEDPVQILMPPEGLEFEPQSRLIDDDESTEKCKLPKRSKNIWTSRWGDFIIFSLSWGGWGERCWCTGRYCKNNKRRIYIYFPSSYYYVFQLDPNEDTPLEYNTILKWLPNAREILKWIAKDIFPGLILPATSQNASQECVMRLLYLWTQTIPAMLRNATSNGWTYSKIYEFARHVCSNDFVQLFPEGTELQWGFEPPRSRNRYPKKRQRPALHFERTLCFWLDLLLRKLS